MAARRRRVVDAPKPVKYREVVEGEVTVDIVQGVVLWDYIPEDTEHPAIPAHGIAVGGLLDARLEGKRVRVTIEEL